MTLQLSFAGNDKQAKSRRQSRHHRATFRPTAAEASNVQRLICYPCRVGHACGNKSGESPLRFS